MEIGVLSHTASSRAGNADATSSLARDTLNNVILQESRLAAAIPAGDVKIVADRAEREERLSNRDAFDPWSDIATP